MAVTTIREALPDLVARLLADGELDDRDLALIHDATVAAANDRQEARRWAELAHVHDEPHAPVVTLEPDALAAYLAAPEHREVDGKRVMVPPEERVAELVDASGVACHDCGRALVADVGEVRILVCPSLHARRPRELAPVHPDGAVECGRRPA